VTDVRFHRELYVEKAIDDAIALYAAHATIAKKDDGAYVTVSVASDRPGRAERVARELGNYALVREDAPRLVERADDAEVKAAASELLRRIEPDPLVKFMLAVAVALFCAVVGYVYLSH
jgi:capsular polysaccharide biosynthesis protein